MSTIFQRPVFVSSSMEELKAERQAIRAALEELGIGAWLFEQDAGARPESIRHTFLKEVEEAKIYIGVFWKTYGRYTVEEYEHAKSRGKACLLYEKRSDLGGRERELQSFLDRVNNLGEGHTVRWFDTLDELKEGVKEDLVRELLERYPEYRPYPINRTQAPTDSDDRRNQLILLDKVKQFWVKGVLEQSVYGEALLELDLEHRPGAVDHPWRQTLELPNREARQVPADKKIDTIFEETGSTLLILGSPGSGKTMKLLELAQRLIGRAEMDPAHPIPVVFNLSSWTAKLGSLSEWLIAEFKLRYNVPARFSRRWLNENRLVLLLDGLDEVDAPYRSSCVDSINACAAEFGMAGLAVCCRLEEYTGIPNRLKLGGAIYIESLKPEQVDEYIASAGTRLLTLKHLLTQDPALQSMARTPLMLSVMTLAYEGMAVEDVDKQSLQTEDLRRVHLFETYIRRMIERKGVGSEEGISEKVKWWLHWMAIRMQDHSKTVFHLEELQPSWLESRSERWSYVLGTRIMSGILAGLPVSIGMGLSLNWRFGFFIAMCLAPISGFIAGVLDLARFEGYPIKRLQTMSASRLIALHVCIHMVVLTAITLRILGPGLQFILIFIGSVCAGIFWGVRSARRDLENDIQTVETLSWSWPRARKVSPLGIGVGFVVGILGGIVFGMSGESIMGIMNGLFIGLIFMAGVVLLSGFESRMVETKSSPNEGIRLSVRNGIWVGWRIGLIAAFIGGTLTALSYALDHHVLPGMYGIYMESLVSGITNGPLKGIVAGLIVSVIDIILVGSTAALWYGGLDVVQHYFLRFILSLNHPTFRKFASLLDYAVGLILLHKVGGGFIFIHRMLLEHFVEMQVEPA